jgi:hypothetical protein
LRALIQQRFGALPSEVAARLQEATPEQLKRWALRVLDAASLDDVLRSDSEHSAIVVRDLTRRNPLAGDATRQMPSVRPARRPQAGSSGV